MANEIEEKRLKKEELFKEIDLIQACINRMAKNSFMIKGWTLTIFAGVLAIAKDRLLDSAWLITCCILVPLISFWILDAFFLHTEKKYRKLYEDVLRKRTEGNADRQFDLNPSRFDNEVGSIWCTIFSFTLTLFYGVPLIAVISLIIHIR